MPSIPSNAKRASAVRYWESRRLGFNLMLVPPAVCGWLGYLSSTVGTHEIAMLAPGALIAPMIVAFVAVNLLYSAVYCLEFLLMCEEEAGYWFSRGRDLTFAAGCVTVFGLAFLGGAWAAAGLLRPAG